MVKLSLFSTKDISLAECNSWTTKKLPFGVNITIDVQNVNLHETSTDTLLSQNIPH
jgi:hypothetical protein